MKEADCKTGSILFQINNAVTLPRNHDSNMFGLEELGLLGLFLGNILAATIVPFSSDALYIAVLAASGQTVPCFIVATLGNWLGSLITYGMGRLGKWEWLEKWFKVKRETLEKQKRYVDRYGVWLSLIAWVPIIGDVLVLALGFYKTPAGWTLDSAARGKGPAFSRLDAAGRVAVARRSLISPQTAGRHSFPESSATLCCSCSASLRLPS